LSCCVAGSESELSGDLSGGNEDFWDDGTYKSCTFTVVHWVTLEWCSFLLLTLQRRC
jgi:hypothetical protein